MPPSAYPDDNWGKKEYLDDVKWYQRSMTSVNQMDLTRKQRSCCENITKTITESKDSKKYHKTIKEGRKTEAL